MNGAVDLVTRFGHGGRNPAEKEMRAAIREIFHEDHSALVEADYEEHPNAWLSFGFKVGEKWTLYTLDLYRRGELIFTKLDDQDDVDPVFTRRKTEVSEAEANRLWFLLATGDIDTLIAEDWSDEEKA